jgi:hypothetical protein
MKKLKISIDKPTLACLLIGCSEMYDAHRQLNVFCAEDTDSCTAATHLLIEEMVGELRNNPLHIQSYPLKLSASRAAAMLYWLDFSRPIDSWTMVTLGNIGQLCRNHMDNHLRDEKNMLKHLALSAT